MLHAFVNCSLPISAAFFRFPSELQQLLCILYCPTALPLFFGARLLNLTWSHALFMQDVKQSLLSCTHCTLATLLNVPEHFLHPVQNQHSSLIWHCHS